MIALRIVLYVIGAFFGLSGIVAIPAGEVTGGVICVGIGALCILLGTKCKRTKKEVKTKKTTAQAVAARTPSIKIAETIRTKLVGVTFDNEDGENRQDILRSMTGNENITVEKYTFNGEPAAYVKWGNKILGNLAADLAKSLERKYPGARYNAEILEISGGGVQTFGCNIELDVIVENKSKEAEKKREPIVYVENNSKKYHVDPNCSGMKNPKSIPLSEAKKKYTACKKCCK